MTDDELRTAVLARRAANHGGRFGLNPIRQAIVDAIHDDCGWVTFEYLFHHTDLPYGDLRDALNGLIAAGIVDQAEAPPDDPGGPRIPIYSCCGS